MPQHCIVVDWLKPGEIPEAASVISKALVNDLNFLALFTGQEKHRRSRIERAIRLVNLEHPRAIALAARREGRLVGAVNMVEWPHCHISLLEGFKLFPKMLPLTRHMILRSFYLQVIGNMIDPGELHWHLGPIGVLPGLQKQGIGTRLVERMCEFFDEQRKAAYLETDLHAIVVHHQRYGFRVIREIDIFKVHNWCMWRPPGQRPPV